MATVTKPTWDRHETQRRIRHPLQALSGHIRRYVVLEGTAVALLFLAVCFWVWLLIDFGCFAAFGLDGVKWLDRAYPAGTAFFIRAFVLGLIIVGLLAVVGFKVLRRLFTEFSDGALALVLERRFPKELGDRLITAVELADTKLADKYGYSQDMVDFTIRAAAERVAQVPVTEVFNWKRLVKQWLLVGLATLGVYLLVFFGSAVALAFNEQSPTDFFGRFNRAASIWTKRNALVMHRVYWPTQSYVEFVRFQGVTGPDGIEVMKVARDEKRPDIDVRAFQWVVYDANAVDSIRPLKLADLKGWVGDADLDIPLAEDWPHWKMSVDDLDASIPTALIPDSWKGKSSGQIRAQLLKDESLRQRLANAGVLTKIESWLNWKNWTVDQLQDQLDNKANEGVRQTMRAENEAALKKFEALFEIGGKLEGLSEASGSNWNIRRLAVPGQIQVTYFGKQTRNRSPIMKSSDFNRYTVTLGDIKENVSLIVQAEDFYTLPRDIVLVPPPQFKSLQLELDEPAYKYYWLKSGPEDLAAWLKQGKETEGMKLLKQARHKSTKVLSLTGPTSQYEVLAGTSVKLLAVVERTLKKGVSLTPPSLRKTKEGVVPSVVPQQAEDMKSFWLEIPNVQSDYEFELRFVDEDNVKGSRHIVIRAAADHPPEELSPLKLLAQLRTSASIAPITNEEGETIPSPVSNMKGFFITPDAYLPFLGIMRDDFGLTNMEWIYDFEEVQFELFGLSQEKDPVREKMKADLERRFKLFALGLTGFPLHPPQNLAAIGQWGVAANLLEKDMQDSLTEAKAKIIKGAPVPMLNFKSVMENLLNKATHPAKFQEMMIEGKLSGDTPDPVLLKEYSLVSESPFDVQSFLGETFKPKGSDVQKHYRLRVWMQATDNNVLTGPRPISSKEPVTFLVISPKELRALIMMQENVIRTELEKIRDKLHKDVHDTLVDQIEKFKKSDAKNPQDLALVRLRVDLDIRKHLDKAVKVINKALSDYQMIRDELAYNRMDKIYSVKRVSEKIIEPLLEITQPKNGNLIRLQEAVNVAHGDLERDEEIYKPDGDNKLPALPENVKKEHTDNLVKTQVEVEALVKKLDAIIEAIGSEISLDQLTAELEAIVESQKRQDQALNVMKKDEIEKLKKLLGGG